MNQRVMIDGERGYYWVRAFEPPASEGYVGTYVLWGGSKDPNGKRRSRTAPTNKVKADKRKLERSLYPEWAK